MKLKKVILTTLGVVWLIAAGLLLGVWLTASSFYYIYGANQTPYDVASRYEECLKDTRAEEDCLLLPVTVSVTHMQRYHRE